MEWGAIGSDENGFGRDVEVSEETIRVWKRLEGFKK
jgi:hypothetical protein